MKNLISLEEIKEMIELIRQTIKATSKLIFGTFSLFLMAPLIIFLIIFLFPFFLWFEDGYFSLKEMIELIIDIYKDIFEMITLKELRDYISKE